MKQTRMKEKRMKIDPRWKQVRKNIDPRNISYIDTPNGRKTTMWTSCDVCHDSGTWTRPYNSKIICLDCIDEWEGKPREEPDMWTSCDVCHDSGTWTRPYKNRMICLDCINKLGGKPKREWEGKPEEAKLSKHCHKDKDRHLYKSTTIPDCVHCNAYCSMCQKWTDWACTCGAWANNGHPI